MFRKNEKHRQSPLFSTVDDLPPKLQRRLDAGWAGTFYRECFARIDESPFEVLYADVDSRPNTPVNVLLGFEILKAGFGWSDTETHDHFCFDLQVRYAVGYRDLSEGHFELRTVYNFRRRVLDHYYETGQDLLSLAFEHVTDAQLESLGLATSKVRMDSTQVTSNIHNFSRLQLLVEVLQRVYRMLCEVDRARYAELLQAYVRESSAKFVFGVSSEEGRQEIARIGQVMATLVSELAANYRDEPTYQLLQRVFEEQFIQEDDDWRPRQPHEIASGAQCTPDDAEATMRRKRNVPHKGYVTNVTETCAAQNPLQLIVKVQTACNLVSDVRLLEETLLSLKRRLDIDECYTDGGYNNERLYESMRALGIQHWQTGIQGHPSSRYLALFRYQLLRSPTGEPLKVICPQGQESPVRTRRPGCYAAHFDLERCRGCPQAEICLAKARKSRRTLHFRAYDAELAKRRQRIEAFEAAGSNPRAAIESTVYSLKRPFGEKLPVRGLFRVHGLMVGSAFMANVRRINRWWQRSLSPAQSQAAQNPLFHTFLSVLAQVAQVLAFPLPGAMASIRI
jgi:hypothetical protein